MKAAALILGLSCITTSLAQASEELMEKNGCISCHRIGDKLIGPPFKAIAAKYRTQPDAAAYLFDKVRNGSEDVWGDIPMPPKSADKLSDDNLRSIIAWLLGL